tara:strand:- start:474 stop:635 length:162 start_codon:yes stop_codon:yes gene_type:complete
MPAFFKDDSLPRIAATNADLVWAGYFPAWIGDRHANWVSGTAKLALVYTSPPA